MVKLAIKSNWPPLKLFKKVSALSEFIEHLSTSSDTKALGFFVVPSTAAIISSLLMIIQGTPHEN